MEGRVELTTRGPANLKYDFHQFLQLRHTPTGSLDFKAAVYCVDAHSKRAPRRNWLTDEMNFGSKKGDFDLNSAADTTS